MIVVYIIYIYVAHLVYLLWINQVHGINHAASMHPVGAMHHYWVA